MSKKVLYFEGAGMYFDKYVKGSDVGNYRIRTAFRNNEGKNIYIELGGTDMNDKVTKRFGWYSRIDHLFFIPENKNDDKIYLENKVKYEKKGYSKEQITKFINETLNCDFDTIEVLPRYEGYRVHRDKGYNIIDNHEVNIERALERERQYNKIDEEFKRKLNSKYSCISIHELDDESMTVRCHSSKEKLAKAGMTDNDRLVKVNIKY